MSKEVMDNKRLFNIFVIVFIDLLGFGLILPLLPFYADEFGATPFLVGLLTAIYAAAQLVGAPLLGRLSDRFGRRPILLDQHLWHFPGVLIIWPCSSSRTEIGCLTRFASQSNDLDNTVHQPGSGWIHRWKYLSCPGVYY